MPDIIAFFETEEAKREFEVWKTKRLAKNTDDNEDSSKYNRREQKQLLSAAFICRFMGITNLVTCFIIRVRGFLLNANREIDFSVCIQRLIILHAFS